MEKKMKFDYLINKYKITERKGYLDVSLPIIIDFSENNCNLVLTLVPNDDGSYVVYATDSMFSDSGYYPQRCYDAYTAVEGNKTYGIKYEKRKFISHFESFDNPIFAIDYFIKFFVALNDFVIHNC